MSLGLDGSSCFETQISPKYFFIPSIRPLLSSTRASSDAESVVELSRCSLMSVDAFEEQKCFKHGPGADIAGQAHPLRASEPALTLMELSIDAPELLSPLVLDPGANELLKQ